MKNPTRKSGTRLCIAVTNSGVTLYGNKQAFKSLSEWMDWIASSSEGEHFECHVLMYLEDDESKFEGKEPRNVWTLIDETVSPSFTAKATNNTGFELTFMGVEEKELDYMAQFQNTGQLPKGWDQKEEN